MPLVLVAAEKVLQFNTLSVKYMCHACTSTSMGVALLVLQGVTAILAPL